MKQSANWLMGDVAAHLKNIKLTITEAKLTPASLAELIALIKDGTISGKIAKEVCNSSYRRGFPVSPACNSVGRLYLCVHNHVF